MSRVARRCRSLAQLVVGASAVAVLGACKPSPPAAKVVVDADRHDFGHLWIGEVRQHVFHVTNEGTIDLYFNDVRSSCGCLVAKLDRKDLPPHQSCDLAVEFHADKAPGHSEKFVSIGTNDELRQQLVLTLSAELETLYAMEPPMIDEKELVLGEPRDLPTRLSVTDGTKVVFGTPVVPEEGFTATVRGASDTACEVVVRFDGDAKPGRRFFHVDVPTGHPLVPSATVPVQTVVFPRLAIEPGDRVDFGGVSRESGGERTFVVRSRLREPLQREPTVAIELTLPKVAEGAAAPVSARLEPVADKAGREWRLVVALAPKSGADSLVGRVIVRLDAPHEPPHTLTITGRLAP